jgi:hypothetical protein
MVTVFADMFAERMDICTSYVSKVVDKKMKKCDHCEGGMALLFSSF